MGRGSNLLYGNKPKLKRRGPVLQDASASQEAGRASAPGTVVINEREHKVEIAGQIFHVTELEWNETDGLSFDVYDPEGELLTEDGSLDEMPSEQQIIDLAGSAGVIETITCKFCGRQTPAVTAHSYQGEWVGDNCCWDERLRATA